MMKTMTGGSVVSIIAWLHIGWGLISLIYPDAVGPSGLANTTSTNLLVSWFGSGYRLGLIMLGAGVLAHLGLEASKAHSYGLLLLIPQQAVTITTFMDVMACVISGQFADGTTTSRAFILKDQLPYILMCPLHFIVLVKLFLRR